MNVLVFIASCFVESVFVIFAIIIARSGLKEKVSRSCFVFLIWFAIWVVLNYLSNIVGIGYTALLFINRALFIVSLIELYSLADFAMSVTQQRRSRLMLSLLIFVIIPISILAITPLVVSGIIINPRSISVAIEFGPMASVYAIIAALCATFVVVILALGVSRGNNQRIRASSKTLLFTIGITITAILTTNILIPVIFGNFDFSIFGLLFGALSIGGVGYSVVMHKLFNIRLAVVRSVTYTLVLIVLAGVYLVIALLFSTIFNSNLTSFNTMVSGVFISLLLAFLFQPIKRFFDKITNRVFYKDNYNSEDFFARLNRTLTFTTDLRSLLERAANEISHTLKSEQAFFFINTDDDHHITAGTLHHRQFPKDDIAQLRTAHNLDYEVIVASLRKDNDQIRRLMLSHRIELILPLVQDDEIIGYLCLGDHLTSGYTNRDIKVLSTISDGLIIAIKNALAVQEIRELNSNLQQRINNAIKELRTSNMALRRLDKAKDEFVSMASHQLRTPLTSVKGYISMVLEGDVGKISDSQRQLLNEAFVGSERMTRLINDFLNVSRIQTGKFMIDKHPFDLSKLIEQEIDSLQPSAKVHNLKFNYNPPKDIPAVEVDEGKIRQVVMNFIDNAIYYSHDGGVVAINLLVEGSNVTFTVKDDGIGIPRNEQAQLFTKFYRATNAKKQRPDGTGVGLYLAKKIINAHDGKMIFESTQDNGSTFGFRLPIK